MLTLMILNGALEQGMHSDNEKPPDPDIFPNGIG